MRKESKPSRSASTEPQCTLAFLPSSCGVIQYVSVSSIPCHCPHPLRVSGIGADRRGSDSLHILYPTSLVSAFESGSNSSLEHVGLLTLDDRSGNSSLHHMLNYLVFIFSRSYIHSSTIRVRFLTFCHNSIRDFRCLENKSLPIGMLGDTVASEEVMQSRSTASRMLSSPTGTATTQV